MKSLKIGDQEIEVYKNNEKLILKILSEDGSWIRLSMTPKQVNKLIEILNEIIK